MRTVLPVLAFLALLVSGFPIPTAMASDEKETAALEVARDWLATVDAERYERSWDTAAGFFKAVVAKGQWVQSLEGARRPLGKVLSRELMSSNYVTELPDAPDGQYVVIQFETSYEAKSNAIETVTPMLEDDGSWRISGYYIK